MPPHGRLNHPGHSLLYAALLNLLLALGPACDGDKLPSRSINMPKTDTASSLTVIAPKSEKPPQAMRTFTDDMKRTREIPEKIERLIVLSGPAVEVAWALGRGDCIVARSEWATWPPQMKKLPSLGSIARPNQELIWALKPDVIVADVHFVKSAPLMERTGVPVLFLSAVHIEDIPRLIERMGRLLHREQRAAEMMAFIKKHLDIIRGPLKDLEPRQMPRVFHGSGRQLYFTSSSKYGRRVIDEAGAANIADSLPFYWQQVSLEWVVQQDPDYMVLSPNLSKYGYKVPSRGEMHSMWRDAVSRPGIRSMRLAREKRLYLLSGRLGYGLRSFMGAIYLAKVFHPQLFPSLNPQQVHAQFSQKFFGLKLEGSYIYP